MDDFTTWDFYEKTYHGDTIEGASFDKWESRAEDFINLITSGRLLNGLPSEEKANVKVQKAVCAVADALCELDAVRKSANSKEDTNIKSRSSGSESITYGTAETAITNANKSGKEKSRYLYDAAYPYLSGVTDDKGICLLYGGV